MRQVASRQYAAIGAATPSTAEWDAGCREKAIIEQAIARYFGEIAASLSDSGLAQADAIEGAVNIARSKTQKVDQAILARVFRGEL